MKAAQLTDYENIEFINIVEIEKPTLKEGQVLVEVHAASLNPFDTTIRKGFMKEAIPLELPVTLGGDIAGIVSEVAEGVENIAIGNKVYGQANIVAGNSGAFAQFAATSAKQVGKAPANLDFNEAASMPLVGVSAHQALTEHIDLQKDQKLFIHGGAGGIGAVAIQIAKHIGAYVATTASGEGIGLVKKLGADEVIDYKSDDFSGILKDFDAAFDTVGGNDFAKTFGILKQSGVAVTMIAQFDGDDAKKHGVTAFHQQTRVSTRALDELTELIESGVVTPNVGKVFSLDEIKEAFTARESGSVQGKVVIEMK
ncbi:MAG: NADP-dependent oxidoreductase [Candidatus Saccharibacteria bacterium]